MSTFQAGDYVHEYDNGHGQVRYVVAVLHEGRYYAPQRRKIMELTGAHTIYGLLDYVQGNAYSYRYRRSALHRARLLYDWETDREGGYHA